MLAVLQLDAVSPARVARLAAEGRMPRLAELERRGRRIELRTPAEHFAGSAFHSLYAGLDPGDHGLYYPFQWVPEEQRVRHVHYLPAPETAWDRAERAGARALVLDLYESRPGESPRGAFISGWQFANRIALAPRSAPASAGRELTRRFGRASRIEEVFGRPTHRTLERTARRLEGTASRTATAAEHLLAREHFDLAWIGLCGPHLGGHWLWDLSQLPPADRERAREAGLDGALDRLHEQADAALGRIVDALPRGADVIVSSALGMDVNTSRSDLLPGMLDAVLGPGRRNGASRRGSDSLGRLRTLAPSGLRGAVASALPERVAIDLTARLDLRGVDWSTTRAFALAGDHHGHVRFNLRGREREGVVRAADAEALADEIEAGLLEFRDPDGAPSVERVVRVREIAAGERAGLLPDLVVVWGSSPATNLAGVGSARLGDVVRPGGGSGTGRSGGHTAEAWALIVPGRSRHREPSRPPRLTDVTATVDALAGGGGPPGEPLLA